MQRCMLFNLLHDMYDFNISDLFTFTPNNHLITRGLQFKYRSRTDLRKYSFSRQVINSWNNLLGGGGIADATSTTGNNFKH